MVLKNQAEVIAPNGAMLSKITSSKKTKSDRQGT